MANLHSQKSKVGVMGEWKLENAESTSSLEPKNVLLTAESRYG